MFERIVTLVDMDCFYCQVEARLNPELQGKPMAVVQYNAWKGGGIIAVNYEARDRGVSRHMRGDEAKKICPEIELVRVASVRGKADLTKYRDASREVFNVICEFSDCVQRASIDEAYIDLTEAVEKRLQLGEQIVPTHLNNTFIIGYSAKDNNNEEERASGVIRWLDEVYNDVMDEGNGTELQRLALGARIVEEMRAAILKKTGFKCSAGIAHNKIMAKLVAGVHKPNRQTVLSTAGVAELFRSLPVQKVRNLGGKFGNDVIEKLGCKVMADLTNFSEKALQSFFDEKTGTWLFNIARGIDLEPVTPRLVSKSIGCCKQFRGVAALKTKKAVLHWISELAHEIAERLDEDMHMNKRKAQLLTVSIQQEIEKKKTSVSRSASLLSYEAEAIADVAFSAIKRSNTAPQSSDAWVPHLVFLGISVGKFTDNASSSNKTINQYFQNGCIPGVSKSVTGNSGNGFYNDDEDSCDEKGKETEESETVKRDCETIEENRESFFERYFKNNKQALVKSNDATDKQTSFFKSSAAIDSCLSNNNNSSINVSKSNFVSDTSNVVSASTSKCDSLNETRSMNSDIKENSSAIKIKSSYFVEGESSKKESFLKGKPNESSFENFEPSVDNVSVSPSEIFPDLNNVDKDVLYMLPKQLQDKILARISEEKSHQEKVSLDLTNTSYNNRFCSSEIGKIGNNNDQLGEFGEMQSRLTSTSNVNHENCEKVDASPLTLSGKVTKKTVHALVHEENSNYRMIDCKMKPELTKYEALKENDNLNMQESLDKIEIANTSDNSENLSQDIFVTEPSDTSNPKNSNMLATSGNVNTVGSSSSTFENILPKEDKICNICHETVPDVIYLEHLDHHYALKLHQQLNSDQQQKLVRDNSRDVRNSNQSKLKKTISPVKRKRGPYKKSTAAEVKKPRSILSFFAPK